MSWWITLIDKNGATIDTQEIRQEGGTQVLGGTSETELNVTYNYGKHFDFKRLDGISANDAIPVLKSRIDMLGNDIDKDYWKPTEGNVKIAMKVLLSFAEYAQINNIKSRFEVC